MSDSDENRDSDVDPEDDPEGGLEPWAAGTGPVAFCSEDDGCDG